MGLKETRQGVLESKQNNLVGLIIGIILAITGLIWLIISISEFDFSNPASYFAPVCLIVGLVLIFTWKATIIILDKNQNTAIITLKKITKKEERKYELTDIKAIQYSESIYRERNTGSRGASRGGFNVNASGTGMRTKRIVELLLKNGEIYGVISYSGRYNPFHNRTKTQAQQIADFIGVPLQSNSLGDTLKEVGNKIFGQNQNNQSGGQI